MKFSIIMPSYLGPYKTAAKDRDKKIIRAIQSVIDQTYQDWELIIISDGCQQTIDIAQDMILRLPSYVLDKIEGYMIDKQPIWSGTPRNIGIQHASGDWIVYLDIDDAYKPYYLELLAKEISKAPGEWYYINDMTWLNGSLMSRNCNINIKGQCGTANLIHKPGILWDAKPTYLHDYNFIQNLINSQGKGTYLPDICGYVVYHIPGHYDL